MIAYSTERPSIKVMVQQSFAMPEVIKQITYGIEEEGIPFQVEMGDGTSRQLAAEGSASSRLGVAIGISQDLITLGYDKLPEDAPLFEIPISSRKHQLRNIGINAARLVKKMPFVM